MPINEFKDTPSCPKQGRLSVAFRNASVLGRCYILHSQPAASVAVVLVPGTKRREGFNPNQPVDGSAEETQTAAQRLLPALQRAMLREVAREH